jgi:FkbM family methyltransferase
MPILLSDSFARLVQDDPLVYVDAGARGGLQGPWAEISDERLRVVAFEPDEEACRPLREISAPRFDVIPKALWSEIGEVKVHLAETRATSSVHPPNFPLLQRFAARHGDPRRTEGVVSVECTTLDASLAGIGCGADFIKLDTQGCEYEILLGASETLRTTAFGVLAESWTVEVHRGQRLTGDLLALMRDFGFSLFDVSVAAAWRRRISDSIPLGGKPQVTGLDLLFFKDPPHWDSSKLSNAVKAAAIAQLYGFPDFAIEILDGFQTNEGVQTDLAALRRQIIEEASPPPFADVARTVPLWRRWLHRGTPEQKPHAAKLHY